MKRGKNLIGLGVAVILGLSLILIPVLNRTSPAEAAVTWTKAGEVTLDSELYVIDAWVIRDGATYKMWYTHGKKDMTLSDLIDAIAGLNLDLIIGSIENLDAESFLADLADLEGDVSAIAGILDGISTVIGYATSTNGTTWTVINSEVLTGSGGAWNSIGAPSVIWDTTDNEYKMWYTRLKTDVDQTALEDILFDMAGTTADQKAAILDLLDGTHTVIGYATSPDGIIWTVENAEVLAGNGQAINSVGAASVIKDDSTYKMWYTQGESDFADSDIDDILADIANFELVVDDVLAVLDSSSTVIRYATSADGINWTGSNPIVLTGSGAAWDSVADPSVIKSGGTYEMWYTEGETSLITADFRGVLDEIAGLANSSWNILKAFVTGDFEALLNELNALDISTITALLDGTRTVIGYATSSDGIIWTQQTAPDLIGSSSPWGSVVAPSVVRTGDSYQMWYTEGIAGLTVENLLALVLGTDLPIGYAYYTPPVLPPTPPPTIETEFFGIEGSFPISNEGVIEEEIVATSDEGDFTITISEGTIALDKDGNPLSGLTVEVDPTPPPPPAEANIIGLPYNFGPPGATFNPPITIEYTVDPLPPGVAVEDVVIAYYDETLVPPAWVELPTTYDPATNTFRAEISHFTTFAIIALAAPAPPPLPAPAAFSVSSLFIQPAEVEPGETITVSIVVANTGGESGSYTVILQIDGVKEAEERVTIAAGESQDVSFNVTREEAGSYTVTVEGLSGSFTVVPVVAPPAPAAFSVSSLSIQPAEVEPGEIITVSIVVANTGGESGSYTVILQIDGVKEAEERVTIAAGESQDVSFSVTREEAGTYSVDVSGLTGSFTVKEKVVLPEVTKAIAWWVWLIIGLVSTAVVGFAVWMVVRRRRA